MSDPVEETNSKSVMDKIHEKVHHYQESSSSSDSESEKSTLVSTKVRLFGRQKPVHAVLGGGKSADIILWRNKQISAGILIGMTILWLVFEWLGYHLLTFICHALIISLGVLCCWSHVSCAINKSPPKLPEVILPEDLFVSIALSLRHEINNAFATFREVASGRDFRKFLMVIVGLWVVSIIGTWFNFLTLFYLVFVILHTVPVLYEKHEDHVDTFVEKAMVEIKKQYKVLDAKVLQKLPKVLCMNKKQH